MSCFIILFIIGFQLYRVPTHTITSIRVFVSLHHCLSYFSISDSQPFPQPKSFLGTTFDTKCVVFLHQIYVIFPFFHNNSPVETGYLETHCQV